MKNNQKQLSGRKPGAPQGNSNAAKNNHYSKAAIQERRAAKNMLQDMTEFLEKIIK